MLIRKLSTFTNRVLKKIKIPSNFNFSNFDKHTIMSQKNPNFEEKKKNYTESSHDQNEIFDRVESPFIGFKKVFIGKNLHEMLFLLKEHINQMENNDKKEVLEIVKFYLIKILSKIENEHENSIRKYRLDKNEDFLEIISYFLLNYKSFENDDIYLLGLFAYIVKVKEFYFIKFNLQQITQKFCVYVEENCKNLRIERLILYLSIYGYFRPRLAPETFLMKRFIEVELCGFTYLYTALQRVLHWDIESLNKSHFHIYFVGIFVELAIKENYHNIARTFKIINKLNNKLIVHDYEKGIVDISNILISQIEQIDKQSVINIISTINDSKFVDKEFFISKINDFVHKNIVCQQDNKEENGLSMILYLLKYFNYISTFDEKTIKSMKYIDQYLIFLENHIKTTDINIDHISSLFLIMKKSEIYSEIIIDNAYDHLINRLFIKNPDESVKACLEIIRKFKGVDGINALSENALIFFDSKIKYNQNIYRSLQTFVKLNHYCSSEKENINIFLNELVSKIKFSVINAQRIPKLFVDWVNYYRDHIDTEYKDKIEEYMLKTLIPDVLLYINEIVNIESRVYFAVYLNEMKNENNKDFIDKILQNLIISKNFLKHFLKYMCISSEHNISSKFLELCIKVLLIIEKDNIINLLHGFILEDIIFIASNYIKRIKIDEKGKELLTELIGLVDRFSQKIGRYTLNLYLNELMNVDLIFTENGFYSKFLIDNIKLKFLSYENDASFDNFYKIKYLLQILKSDHFEIDFKNKIISKYLTNKEDIKNIFEKSKEFRLSKYLKLVLAANQINDKIIEDSTCLAFIEEIINDISNYDINEKREISNLISNYHIKFENKVI